MKHRPTKRTSEVAVVGAGPAGCLASLALAQKGHRVTVFEADRARPRRFAGEWLHPSGLEVLRRWNVLGEGEAGGIPGGVEQRGFAIFPDDDSEPVLLDYPDSARGIVCEHGELVETLRRKALATPGVEILSGTRVRSVAPGSVTFQSKGSDGPEVLAADRIIGADGRTSVVREALGLSRGSRSISRFVGLIVEGAELPHEGYGHVMLGAPGPSLAYRIAPDRVRVSLDVPLGMVPENKDWPALLAREYAPYLPGSLRSAFLRDLEKGSLAFRNNGFRSRIDYGNEEMTLVGDAVGFHHPLTAMGMTLGFQDADGLARAGSFAEFERERRAMTVVPELLAVALFRAFSQRDPGMREVRRAICRMWRAYPRERERTIRLLSGGDTSPFVFGGSFLRGAQLALSSSVDLRRRSLRLAQMGQTAGSIGQLLLALANCSSERVSRRLLDLPLAGMVFRPHEVGEGRTA